MPQHRERRRTVMRYDHRGRGPRPAGPPSRTYFQTVQGLVLVVALAAGAASVQAAQQTFKDDAGRVIYTIDDDGAVSMFENSPTDLTISVTRGPREQMQPQIMEVSPQSIPAGSSSIIRLQGRNLVGAAVRVDQPGIEIGPYATRPKNLDVPITIALNVPPGSVTLTITTPIGQTTAAFDVREMQLAGSGTPKDSVRSSSTTAPTSCPDGMVRVSAELGMFCIDIDRTFSGDYGAAEKACAKAGKRLCQAPEWQHACEQSKTDGLPLKNMIGAWEWTGSWDPYQYDPDLFAMDLTPDIKNLVMGKEDCRKKLSSPRWKAERFEGRCCK